jgi:resolvase-like protein
MRTALYLRVSTSHQKPDLQTDGLRHYATCAGLEIVAEYMDVAVSGRKEGRPQLQALMRSARHREFACVLVWKFDRFARSVSHLLRALEEFHHCGIRFISVQDQVDTESPMGKAMFTIIGAMAESDTPGKAGGLMSGAASKAVGPCEGHYLITSSKTVLGRLPAPVRGYMRALAPAQNRPSRRHSRGPRSVHP